MNYTAILLFLMLVGVAYHVGILRGVHRVIVDAFAGNPKRSTQDVLLLVYLRARTKHDKMPTRKARWYRNVALVLGICMAAQLLDLAAAAYESYDTPEHEHMMDVWKRHAT